MALKLGRNYSKQNKPAQLLKIEEVPRVESGTDNKVLHRTTFEISRELEYFTEKELRAQIGHGPEYWPVAILRELIDNSLDASEIGGILPEIDIVIANDYITVRDNGPGIPMDTLVKSMNYMLRVSDKTHYVSPTRGQMGNALKVIWAAPFVSTGECIAEVITHGRKHRIQVTLDRIGQRPEIVHTSEACVVKNGTSVSISWKNSSRLLNEPEADSYKTPTVMDLVSSFALFNPHATFILNGKRFDRTTTDWKKWRPDDPTSVHWYDEKTLRDLVAGYVAMEHNGGRAKTVREFVSEFRGLSGTAKQKGVTGNWTGKYLRDFIKNGDIDMEFVQELLEKMKSGSSVPAPTVLGYIGKDHITNWMVQHGVTESSIKYIRKAGVDELPYILEMAFGVNVNDYTVRRIVTGLNWSPVIGGDPDPTLRSAISEARLDPHDPVTFVVHISRPRFDFADRGKTRLTL